MSEFVNETVPSLHALHKLILDGDLTDAARMCDKLAAHQAVPTLPEGWVPCVITYEGQHPEEIAYGPQIMMDRLKKWLDRYFEMRTHPAQQGLDAPNEWEGIHTMPTCDDLIWLYCQDTNTIDGPIAPDPSHEQYGWTHWAYANAPSTAVIDAAQAKQGA